MLLSKFDTFPQQEEYKQLMVVAPIENHSLIKAIRDIQTFVGEKFNLQKTSIDDDPLHISFAVPIRANSAELQRLQEKLQELTLSTMEIELGEVKAFPGSNTIYLEIKDNHGKLAALNDVLIQKIKDSGIPCDIRFAFLPHITLYFGPDKEVANESLREVMIPADQKFYLTEVALSEQITSKGETTYNKLMTLPEDIYIQSKNMELDYFKGEMGEQLYLSQEFNNNPLADYYRLLNKLDEYDSKMRSNDHETPPEIRQACSSIYKKILGFDVENYPENLKALMLYARGLIFQYRDRLEVLLTDPDSAAVKTLDQNELYEKAKFYFQNSFETGYIPAAKNLGLMYWELKDFEHAEYYLDIATKVGITDVHASRSLAGYFPEHTNTVIAIPEENSPQTRCMVM